MMQQRNSVVADYFVCYKIVKAVQTMFLKFFTKLTTKHMQSLSQNVRPSVCVCVVCPPFSLEGCPRPQQ